MPNKVVNVPTVGQVSFPDNMSDGDIAAAIQKNYPHLAPPPAAPTGAQQSLPSRIWGGIWDPVPAAKALGVPAEQARLKDLEQKDLAKLSAGYQHTPGTPWPAQTPDEAPGYLATLGSAGFQQRDIDPHTGQSQWLSPGNLALTAGASLISGAGMIGKAASAAASGYFGYKGEEAARKPQQPGESWYDYRARQVAGGAQALLGGLHAASYLGGESAQAVQPSEQPPPVARLKPGAPPQGPAPAANVPRTIDVQATRVSEPAPVESPAVTAARAKTSAMQARVASGELTPEQYQTWFRTGKSPEVTAPQVPPEPTLAHEDVDLKAMREENFKALAQKQDNRGVPNVALSAEQFAKTSPFVEPQVGPQEAVRPPKSSNSPAPLDKTVQSATPPITAAKAPSEAVEPRATEPEAVLLPPKVAEPAPPAKPLSFYQDKMLSAWDRTKKAQATPEKLPWAKQSLANAFGELAKAATGHEDEVAAWFRKDIPHLEELHNYLKSHLDARSTINDIQQKLYDKLAAWGGTHMIDPSTGLGSREPGVSHAVREVLGTMMGNRRVEVPDEKAVIPEGDLPPHILEAKEQLAEIKEAISGGMLGPNELDDAIDKSKQLEELTSEYDRPALKTHGHPTKEAVALAKGLSPEELAVTGAGKAISINHGGLLPVMTSAIWENEYGGPKGKFSPAPELRPPVSKKGPFKPGEFEALEAKKIGMMQAKLGELESEIAQRKHFADAVEARKPEAGYSAPGLLAGFSGGMATGAVVGGAIGGPIGAVVGAVAGGVTGTIGAGLLQSSLKGLEADLADARMATQTTHEEAHGLLKEYLAPVSTDARVTNPIFLMKGNIDEANFLARETFKAHRKFWMGQPNDEVIAYHDRKKNGIPQPTQALQDYADLQQTKNDDLYNRMNDALQRRQAATGAMFNPIPYLENHDRIAWKNPKAATSFFRGSRQLFGDQGMLKQHVYNSMGEGIAHGLEPWHWNPVDNDALAWEQSERFIHGTDLMTRMIYQDKAGGPGAHFVKTGEAPPPDYQRAENFANLKVFFPAKSGEGLVQSGEWFVHNEYGRMLDNYFSPDLIRRSATLRGILGWRRAIGTMALFGPFHAYAMSFGAMATQSAIGLREVQEGIFSKDVQTVASGLKDLASSMFAPITATHLGSQLRKAEVNPAFWQGAAGQKLIAHYGQDAPEYLSLIWRGGGKNAFSGADDLNTHFKETLQQSFANALQSFKQGRGPKGSAQLLKAIGTAPFAMLEMAMDPVFKQFVPNLKLGTMFKDMDISLQERADDIAAGKITEDEIARQVVNRNENLFGELNLDNLFWNNTQKAIAAGWYRSSGWRFGTMRWLADSAKDPFKRGQPRVFYPNLTVIGTLIAATFAASYIFMKTVTGKTPSTLTDALHPQTGTLDDRGKPLRFDWPNYASRDLPQIFDSGITGPFKYATGGMADLWQDTLEAWRNKNFDGSYLIAPRDQDHFKGIMERVAHALAPRSLMPGLFTQQATERLIQSGLSRKEAATIGVALGGSLSSRRYDLSSAEETALQIETKMAQNPMSPEQLSRYNAIKQMASAIRNNGNADEIFDKAFNAGVVNDTDYDTAYEDATNAYVERAMVRLGRNNDPAQAILDSLEVYKAALKDNNPDELDAVYDTINATFNSRVDSIRDPKQQEDVINQFDAIVK